LWSRITGRIAAEDAGAVDADMGVQSTDAIKLFFRMQTSERSNA
jgi:hypothetical protein